MKKIIRDVLPVLLLSTLFFCIGYGLAESLDSKEKVETLSHSDEQTVQKPVYLKPLIKTEDKSHVESISIEEVSTTEPIEPSTKPVTESVVEPVIEEPIEESIVEPVVEHSNEALIGSDFKLYHYAPTGNATASGRMPVVGTTVAVDPRYIKLGTWLRIEIPDGNGGYTVYKHKVRADDTGGDIKGHTIDIFVGSTSEAKQLGVIRNAKVYIIEE